MDANCTEIIPGIYLGNMIAAQTFEGAIVSLYSTSYVSKNVLPIYIADTPKTDISCYFSAVNEFILLNRRRGIPVLLHCKAGISRSATILCAFLMQCMRITTDEALTLIKKRRPCIRPNRGFLQQLRMYEERLSQLSNMC